jgi:hypothetical protein
VLLRSGLLRRTKTSGPPRQTEQPRFELGSGGIAAAPNPLVKLEQVGAPTIWRLDAEDDPGIVLKKAGDGQPQRIVLERYGPAIKIISPWVVIILLPLTRWYLCRRMIAEVPSSRML